MIATTLSRLFRHLSLGSRASSHVVGLLLVMSSTASAIAPRPESKSFTTGGVQIHYLVAGRGEPVVLIHGLHSSAEMNWVRQGIFGALATDHQVIALDLPGHGESDKPAEEKAYGLTLVEDVVRLLDELKISKAHVVGYSLGGMITVKLLVLHSDRVLSATVGGMGWLREGSRLQKFWEQTPGRDESRTPVEFLHSVGKLAVTANELKKIKVPVEVIVGDRDPVKRFHVMPLAAVRPDWPVVVIPEAGHINCVMRPQFSSAIVEWVHKNERR